MRYLFEECELDVERVELMRRGEPVPVEPQVFALLLYLVENQDRVIGKDELIEQVWRGRIVTDSALSSRIKKARKAVGDDGTAQRLIATVHRVGFRFVGNARLTGETGWADRAETETGLSRRVAVLPFRTLADDALQRVVAEGIAEDVITLLGRSASLSVIARGSSFRFRGASEEPLDAAKALGADYLVSGSLVVADGNLRLRACLVDSDAGTEVWAQNFDGPLNDLLGVQMELASAVAAAAEIEIQLAAQRRALNLEDDELDAWSAYHRGVWHMYRFHPASYERAEADFRRALELVPGSLGPMAGLSFVYWQRAFLELDADRAGAIATCRKFADACVGADPGDPLGHWALGRALLLYDDLDGSVGELRSALSLNPSSVSSLYSLARSLIFTGELDESDRHLFKARSLSPFDPMTFGITSLQAMNASDRGDHHEALSLIELAARQPNAHYHIDAVAALCYAKSGDRQRARHYLKRLHGKRPGYGSDDFLRAFPYRSVEKQRDIRTMFTLLA